MKIVPNLISYRHEFLWNFSQFLAIYFELFSSGSKFNSEIADMRGPPVSRRSPRQARLSARRRHVAAMRPRRAIKAPTDSAVPTAPFRCPSRVVASPRLASRAPVPTTPSPVSEANHVAIRAPCHCPSAPPPLSGRLRRRELLYGERSPKHPP
jgi:hypothetical protein